MCIPFHFICIFFVSSFIAILLHVQKKEQQSYFNGFFFVRTTIIFFTTSQQNSYSLTESIKSSYEKLLQRKHWTKKKKHTWRSRQQKTIVSQISDTIFHCWTFTGRNFLVNYLNNKTLTDMQVRWVYFYAIDITHRQYQFILFHCNFFLLIFGSGLSLWNIFCLKLVLCSNVCFVYFFFYRRLFFLLIS